MQQAQQTRRLAYGVSKVEARRLREEASQKTQSGPGLFAGIMKLFN